MATPTWTSGRAVHPWAMGRGPRAYSVVGPRPRLWARPLTRIQAQPDISANPLRRLQIQELQTLAFHLRAAAAMAMDPRPVM
uniref:Uncharacterized protein n=1 Tax=Oryza meridionalis TaxID=40149 RepID=A0A0E0E7X1_9ORYZ